ncbi:MAG: DUF6159 family protein [Bacteroidota bacterium]|nr:DUF6159 family protein [Bacteroidota bacterium]
MNFFDRLENGWTIAMSSFKVLKEKKELIIFPVLSGISILLVLASFIIAVFASSGWDRENIPELNTPGYYLVLFGFYVVNYFIVVFFNMALIHCARLYFRGEEVTVRAGLQFSVSRIGVIFSWAFFAATVGLLLRIIQENVGSLGKIITGLIGVVWSVATFFVVPVIAYENAGPLEAVKRSSQLMKQKWGESLGATFSLGFIQVIGIILVGLPLYFLGSIFHPLAGIALAILGAFMVISIISAAQTIFVSAVYDNIDGDLDKHFDKQMVDQLFEKKKKSWF